MAIRKRKTTTTESISPVETSFQTHWRPAMGWVYMVIIIFDFMIAPVLWSLAEIWIQNKQLSQWSPLTLNGGGLFHVAMGAVLGVTSWQRSQEKIQTVRNSFNLANNRGPDEYGDADQNISRRTDPEVR